ncbi:hypothetical protein ACL2XP_07880 [Sodalis sp. RH21]|uniref:hypothetical protein n=1 Tax=unclassified Sodalis (in: enterobacteria) TaxID=2636512 RepID=UPI0039B4D077
MPDHDIAALIQEHRVLLDYAVSEAIAQYRASAGGGSAVDDDNTNTPRAINRSESEVNNEQH